MAGRACGRMQCIWWWICGAGASCYAIDQQRCIITARQNDNTTTRQHCKTTTLPHVHTSTRPHLRVWPCVRVRVGEPGSRLVRRRPTRQPETAFVFAGNPTTTIPINTINSPSSSCSSCSCCCCCCCCCSPFSSCRLRLVHSAHCCRAEHGCNCLHYLAAFQVRERVDFVAPVWSVECGVW